MKTSILALAAWLAALPTFLRIVEIIVAPKFVSITDATGRVHFVPSPEVMMFGDFLHMLGGICMFALPIGLALLALRRIRKAGSNLKGAAWANWALGMSVFGIVTILLRFSTGGQIP